ncbi:MAG TPA: ChuX/HutX family heme-like substrate-binding protein [Alphaproteobacteria bacterium]|nr:ChuX/HutX family heme-like substrate-binding protein [Alphaproteobacteria bacterium]
MMLATTSEHANAAGALAGRWRQFRQENPKVRIRDAARALGTSEAELVATGCGSTAQRLRPEWTELLKALPALGRVMALTRNEQCVHERHGAYLDVSVTGMMGLVLGPDIDLRLFLSGWRHVFAVTEQTAHGERRSVQIFDQSGVAMHKVYATVETDADAFTALVARFRHEDQRPTIVTEPAPAPVVPRADSEIDVAALRDGWGKLEDTHDFFGMLRRLKVERTQAFRLAGPDFARPLRLNAARAVLEGAAERAMPIMIFVGNRGCIQIHTGPVRRLVTTGPWLNVLDPDFNLHLREDGIASAWLVRKPTRDGDVTSVEVFDAAGEPIAMLLGKRKPGQPEDLAWRSFASGLAA